MSIRNILAFLVITIFSIPLAYSSCKQFGDSLIFGGSCCEGFVLNPHTIKCDMPVVSDPSMSNCSNDSACSGGTGCYPQRATDLFSNLSAIENEAELEAGSTLMDAQIETLEDEDPRPLGASCVHPRQCESYSCSNKKCVEVKVCRFADVSEFAPGNIKCGRDLIKTNANICEPDPSIQAANDDSIDIALDGASCQFKIGDATAKKAQMAMKSMRAMEWLFATNDFENKESCLGINDLMKNEVAGPLSSTRKNLLRSFSTTLSGIETDFQTLISAKELGDQVVTIHLDEKISAKQLSTRQTSGYDSLVMMMRRNVMFQDYESGMLDSLSSASMKVSKLTDEMKKWGENDTSWNLGTSVFNYRECRPNWEYWLFKWKPFKLKKTKNRVANIYVVKTHADKNKKAITQQEVFNHINLIYRNAGEAKKYTNVLPSYYLLDPLMRKSPLDFDDFGWEEKLDDILLAIFVTPFLRVKKDPLNLTGNKHHHISAIYDRSGDHITNYVKGLKPEGLNGFVYDPELVNSSAKDCLDPNNKNKADCDLYTAYLKDLQNEAFAQWFAFSAHTKNRYKSYFKNHATGRIKLFEKYVNDMSILVNYYTEVLKLRDTQNLCIERVVKGLEDNGILDSSGGMEEGNYYDPNSPGAGSASSGSSNPSAVKNKLTSSKFSFNFAEGANKTNGKTNLDKVDKSKNDSQSANVRQSALALLAARKDEIKKNNALAASKGVDVDGKLKEYKDLVASVEKQTNFGGSLNSTASKSGALSIGGVPSFGSSNTKGSANSSDKDGEGGKTDAMTGVPGGNTVDLNNGKGLYGSSSSSGSSFGSGEAGADDGNVNSHGISDADQERMLSEYERNKKDYKSNEEDDLFGKVSKAYARNLEKVLTRKKKVD